MENVTRVSAHVREWACRGARGIPVQGLGLLLGLRMPRPAGQVQKDLFARRVLTGTASDPAILRLLPALSFSLAEADLLLGALGEVLG